MKKIILFPSSIENINEVDPDYRNEHDSIMMAGYDFSARIFNYDDFIAGKPLKINWPINKLDHEQVSCIYRGWMMKPEQYERFDLELFDKFNIALINTLAQYENCHLFPLAYPNIKDFTPGCCWYDKEDIKDIDALDICSFFDKFMIKDYVKSVKGHDFPKFFIKSITQEKLSAAVKEFIQLREPLYTGGIVFKQFVELQKYENIDATNEYRAFYFKDQLLSISPNSNQNEYTRKKSPIDLKFVKKFKNVFDNEFYTIDFAELVTGEWTILEVGDGQVSGLSPNQSPYIFYDQLSQFWND